MKLIGSKTEEEFREQLKESFFRLFHSDEKHKLLDALVQSYSQVKTAYILHWIPEQGEDLYTVLINNNIISYVEIEKEGVNAPIVHSIELSEYKKGLKKNDQIRLAVALDLAEEYSKDER